MQCAGEMSGGEAAKCCMRCVPVIAWLRLAQHCGICSLLSASLGETACVQELLHVKLLIILTFSAFGLELGGAEPADKFSLMACTR